MAGHPIKGGPKAQRSFEPTGILEGNVYGKPLGGPHPNAVGQKSVVDLDPPPLEACGKKIVGV
jgi:hypothetical protein